MAGSLVWRRDGGSYGFGGLGSRSTLFNSRMSSFGSWQCCSGFSPGTLSASSKGAISGELPKRLERAETTVASSVVTRTARNFMLQSPVLTVELVSCRLGGGGNGGGGAGGGELVICWSKVESGANSR